LSLDRYDKRRDANEAQIVADLRKIGAKVHLFDEPVDLCEGESCVTWGEAYAQLYGGPLEGPG